MKKNAKKSGGGEKLEGGTGLPDREQRAGTPGPASSAPSASSSLSPADISHPAVVMAIYCAVAGLGT